MDKSAIDTPSREIDLGNIPVHLRTALRRALEFEARAPAPRSAEEVEQCEEQLRAIADEFFGALLTPVLQRAVRSAAVGDAASALVRHLPRRMRSDGLETVNVRTSRGTTVPVTTPYYRRETRPSGEAEAGTLPRLGGAGHLRPVHAEAGLRCKPRGRHAQLAGRSAGAAPLRRHRPGYQDPPLDRLSLRCAGPSGPAERGVRSAGPRDRQAGGRLPRRGPRPCEAQEAWPQDEEGAQPIPYRLEGTEAPHPVRRRRRRATVSDVGPDHRRHAPGPEAVFALLLSYARQIGLNAADKVLFIADGAPWIWRRIQRLIAALGLSPTQVLGLIDFYHAAKQLSDAVKLRRWSATQRTRWLNRTRGLLKRARVDEVITALRELCRGRTAGKIRTHPQLLPEEPSSFRLHHNGRARASAGQRRRRKRHPSRHQSPHQGRIHLLATGERRRDSSPAVFL